MQVSVLICLCLPVGALSQQQPDPEARVLPDFDSRIARPGRATPSPAAQAALGRLVPGPVDLTVRFDARTGAIRQLAGRRQPLTGPRGGSPLQVATEFVTEFADLFGLTPADVPGLVLSREYRSAGESVTHVTFDQRIGGIAVFGAALSVHVGPQGEIVSVTSSAAPDRQDARGELLDAPQAIQQAAADIRPELSVNPVLVSGPTGADAAAVYDRGPFARDIDVRLMYFSTVGGLTLAWRIELEPVGFPQRYEILVDAETGEVLYRWNLVRYADGYGSVLQSDAMFAFDPRQPDRYPLGGTLPGPGDPAGGCAPLINYASRSLNEQFRDRKSVLFNGGSLAGNNARVFRTAVGQPSAQGRRHRGDWTFDFGFNTVDSAETFVFFAANFVHDFFYDLGFDEAAGNFQMDNFGRGGLEGDALSVVARATGRNNATWQPEVDGTSPVMSLFLFDGQGCWSTDVDNDGLQDLDSDYDLDIIIHEFHHGVSTRLNPAWAGHEAGAIGEGGGDFFAYSVNGDTRLADYSFPDTGIRQINGKTYADWFCLFGIFCSPHANGEIWANALWDLRERFRGDLVGGSDAAAVNEIHQLYVDGLKLSAPAPTMLDMRDAVLLADQLRNPDAAAPGGSANYCRLWEGFSGRGMGAGAQDTQATGNFSVVASFTLPEACGGGAALPTATIGSAGEASELGPVAATVTVTLDDVADAALDVLYQLSGSATSGVDFEPLPGLVTVPAGASSATFTITPIDDAEVENDETVVVTLAGGSGYLVGQPGATTVVITSDDFAADLTIAVADAPPSAGAGDTVVVSDTTRNQGQGDAEATITAVYLSTNFTLDPGDVSLGQRAVPPLSAGAENAGTTSVVIPSDTTAGTYYVLVHANDDNSVAESSTFNNTLAVSLGIGPDLVVSALSGPASAGAGGTWTATDTTINQGAGSAGNSTTRFYLSTNFAVDADDFVLGSRPVPALAAGASSSASTALTVPADTDPGSYFVLAAADGGGDVAESSETNNLRATPLQIGPDLAISAVSAPSTAGPGTPFDVADTTINKGAGSAGNSTTRFYLSTNFAVDADDFVLGSRPVPALPAGASSSAVTSVTVPVGTAAGSYWLLAQADADVVETSEFNNVRFASIKVGADLFVSALSAPSTAGAGTPFDVTDTTANQGTGNAGASTTRLYLSTNFTIDAGDVVLGDRAVGALAPGASNTGTTSAVIPAGTAAGSYWLLALADADDAVVETAELNNVRFASLKVGADLIVSTLTAPSTTGPGVPFTVTDTTTNQGTGDAGTSTTRLYLSTNFTIDAGDVVLGDRTVPALAAGVADTGTTSAVIPAGTAAGSYWLLALADADADADDVVVETIETNNSKFALLKVGADLIVSTLTAPSTAGTGVPFTVTDTTTNQGTGEAGASTTRLYLSTNFVIDAGDLVIGGRTVPTLASGIADTGTTSAVIPAGTAAGSYWLLALADADNVVVETIETNNSKFALLKVGADLIVSTLTAPSTAGTGVPFTVTDTTTNQGTGEAGASTTRLYLSTNFVIDAGDLVIGGRTVPTLASGIADTGTTSAVIPAGTAAGSYWLLALADADNVVVETSETNNSRFASIRVGPDLVISTMSAPSNSKAGSVIDVSDTTRNQGSGPAGSSTTRFYLSTNFTLDAGDLVLGARGVPALGAGETSADVTALAIPAGTAAGTYYLLAQADADGVVAEPVETNNVRFRSLKIVGGPKVNGSSAS